MMAACLSTVLSVNAQTVSKTFKDQTLKSVLKEIELQTGLSVIYNSDYLNEHKLINAEFEKTPVETVLSQILDSKLDYSIVNKMIVIHENRSDARQTDTDNGSLTGVVTNPAGEPLAGASVVIIGDVSKGAVTNAQGRFSINGVTDKDVLEVVYLGYIKRSVPVGASRYLSIVLDEDATQIEELVVVGYGVQKRSDITGSVTSVKSADLISAPVSNTAQALQGRVAGVMVQNNSGAPGAEPTIRIRGANSLAYGNNPLVIIDGVNSAVGDLNSLNPNQIASMEVLKDAAALSIYGSSGANGAILVTTKLGGSENATISYNGYVSVDRVAKMLPTLDAWEYASLYDERLVELGNSPYFGGEAISMMGRGTNWQSELFRVAVSHNHNVSVGGSKSDILSYYVAAGISQNQGIILNNSSDLYNIRGNFKARANKRLDFTMNVYGDYRQNHRGGTDVNGALQWAPTKPVYEANGTYSQPESGGIGPNETDNPVASALEGVDENYGGSFRISLKGDYRLWDFLKVSSQLVYKMTGGTHGYFENKEARNGSGKDLSKEISGSKSLNNDYSLQNTNILSFDKTWGKHNIQATAVYEITKAMSHTLYGDSKGIPVNMSYYGIKYGTQYRLDSGYGASATQSIIGRVNYSYDSRYMLSASFRRDGASQLAVDHKYGNFWAVSAGWNLVEEGFMESIKPVLSEFKLRGSYGVIGKASVRPYSSHMLFEAGLDMNDMTTLRIIQAENRNLRWERLREFNIGFDASLWNNRLNVTVEYYRKKTVDLIMSRMQPVVTNVDMALANVGSISNVGWDFSIGGTPFAGRDFAWIINWTLNLNKNKILELDGINDEIIDGQLNYSGIMNAHVQKVGQPMSSFRGYTFAGTWKTEEASIAAMYGYKPGDAKYVDIDRNGKYDEADITILGNAQPKGVFGINNSFRYKNLDLNIFFQGVWGNKIWNMTRVRRETYGDAFPTDPVIRNHWTPQNQTDMPSFTGQELMASSRWVENGSYLRLKNLSIGYRLPDKWISWIHVSSLRVYASAGNLWTITNYSGYDPEAQGDVDAMGGVDHGVYPGIKSFVFGIDLSF